LKKLGNIFKKSLMYLLLTVVFVTAVGAVYYFCLNTKSAKAYLEQRHLNVPYKETETGQLKLDIYMPKRKLFTKTPVLVYFHGGSWKSGSKNLKEKDLELFNIFFEAGFALVSADYRLTSEVNKFPVHADDGADAVRWVIKNAETYGFDKNKVNLIGASAGGHMVLLLGMAGDRFGDNTAGNKDFQIRSIIDLCGPKDLTDLSDYTPDELPEIEDLLVEFLGGTYEEKKDLYELASPIYHVRKDVPPIFMAHGRNDEMVPFPQAEKFFQKAKSANAKVKFVPVDNANHYFQAPENETTNPPIWKVFLKMALFLLKNNIF
jgi:acetyl esterase/lipase